MVPTFVPFTAISPHWFNGLVNTNERLAGTSLMASAAGIAANGFTCATVIAGSTYKRSKPANGALV